ncbi:MAG: DnaJ domain-containing protein [Sandaracinaceae bacterium]
MTTLPLSPLEGFVLSRIDGEADVDVLADLTSITSEQVGHIVERLIRLGAVEWARESVSRPRTRPPDKTPSGAGGVPEVLRRPPPGSDRPRERSSRPPTASGEPGGGVYRATGRGGERVHRADATSPDRREGAGEERSPSDLSTALPPPPTSDAPPPTALPPPPGSPRVPDASAWFAGGREVSLRPEPLPWATSDRPTRPAPEAKETVRPEDSKGRERVARDERPTPLRTPVVREADDSPVTRPAPERSASLAREGEGGVGVEAGEPPAPVELPPLPRERDPQPLDLSDLSDLSDLAPDPASDVGADPGAAPLEPSDLDDLADLEPPSDAPTAAPSAPPLHSASPRAEGPASPPPPPPPDPEAGAEAPSSGARPSSAPPPAAATPAPEAPGDDLDLEPERRSEIDSLWIALDLLDHYQILSVERSATRSDIRNAYFALSKRMHPDTMFRKRLGGFKPKMESIFQRATEAYEVLSRKLSREEYDRYLAKQDRTRAVEAVVFEAEEEVARRSSPPPAEPTATQVVPPRPPPEDAAAAGRPGEPAEERPAQVPPAPGSLPTLEEPPPKESRPAREMSPEDMERARRLMAHRLRAAVGLRMPPSQRPPRPPPRPGGVKARSGRLPQVPRPASAPRAPARSSPRPPADLPTLEGEAPSPSPPPSPAAPRAGGPGASPPPGRPGPKLPSDLVLRQLAGSLRSSAKHTGGINDLDRQVRTAQRAEKEGDIAAAVKALRLAVAYAPERFDLEADLTRLQSRLAAELADDYEQQALYEQQHGKWKEAAVSWSKVFEGRPEDPVAARRAARAIVQAGGDLHKAQELAQSAVDLEPNGGENLQVLGQVYMAAGLRLNARRVLEQAAQMDPGHEMVENLLRDLEG